jgi:membrane fusion protein (multidrug efflux system)
MLKRTIAGLALLSGIAAATTYRYRYWTVSRFLESTDDAYVKADYTTIAPKVSGYIADVLVEDNEPVKAGQLLARIDERDFRTALDQATADVATAEAAIRNLDAQIVLQNSVIDQQKADIAATEASLKFAHQDNVRYQDLMKTGYGTVQRAQQTDAALRERVAQLDRAHAGLVAAQNKVEVLSTERTKAEAQRDHARAVEHQAELNLSYTVISAPVDGTVGARSLRVGQYVEAGTQLMAVVPLSAAYIVANFKETQLAHVWGGEPVEVEIDGYSSVTLTGHVDSLAPASGLEFALLPPDNATGNFTKIVQRIPVKIVLDGSALTGRLRPGMSVEPVIDTKATVLAERRQKAAALALPAAERRKEGSS